MGWVWLLTDGLVGEVYRIVGGLAVWGLLIVIEALCDILLGQRSIGGSGGELITEGGYGLVVGLDEIIEVSENFADILFTFEPIGCVLLILPAEMWRICLAFVDLLKGVLH